jgi:predicted metal-dependent hydrolase
MSEAHAETVSALDLRPGIHVRRPKLDLPSDIPRYWCRNEPFATHILDGLSSVFPPGEAFFVRSVLHFSERLKGAEDARLLAEVRAFAGQEGRHSHEHDRHLEMLVEHGYTGLVTRNRIVDRMLRWSNKRQPVTSLASTASVEHLTALLARVLLTDDRMVHGMDSRMKELWQWHALEEAEHKSVAYDVLLRVSSSRFLRNYMLVLNTFGMFVEVLDRAVYMLWKDGELFRRKTWSDGWRFLFAGGRAATSERAYQPRGILRDFGPEYRAWYRSDFHPAQHDDSKLIAEYEQQFAAYIAG